MASHIGMELVEIPDWCCCGTSASRVTDGDLDVALPARSLALAEKMDPGLDVTTPCAGCFNSLKTAVHYARKSEANRQHLEDLIEMPYAAYADVLSFLEIMSQPENKEALANAMTGSLKGMKVACYYGCTLVRPKEVCKFDNVENPQSMDELMRIAGAEPVPWAFKSECCGASHNVSEPKAARVLIERIYEDAVEYGAEAIVTACPLCNLNLDMREKEINAKRFAAGKEPFDLPVFYFTELLGLGLGGKPKQLGLDRHFWPTDKAVEYRDKPEEVKPVEEPLFKKKIPKAPETTKTQDESEEEAEVVA